MSAKLKIDLSNGLLEIEGEDALVEKIYNDFKGTLVASTQNDNKARAGQQPTITKNTAEVLDIPAYNTLAEFFSAFGEKAFTEGGKALVAAAYVQKKDNLDSFTAQKVSKELKHIGQGVNNITNAMQSNIDSKPQLIIQLKKAGTSKQAKKSYKVTAEGFKKISRMLSGESDNLTAAA